MVIVILNNVFFSLILIKRVLETKNCLEKGEKNDIIGGSKREVKVFTKIFVLDVKACSRRRTSNVPSYISEYAKKKTLSQIASSY